MDRPLLLILMPFPKICFLLQHSHEIRLRCLLLHLHDAFGPLKKNRLIYFFLFINFNKYSHKSIDSCEQTVDEAAANHFAESSKHGDRRSVFQFHLALSAAEEIFRPKAAIAPFLIRVMQVSLSSKSGTLISFLR